MTRHSYDCRVRFSDVDVYGHVNNVKYFEYYQEARLVFLNSLKQDDDAADAFSLVVARLEVDYRRPILFRTEVYSVETWVVRVGRSSFVLNSHIKDGDELLSRAETTLVAFDMATQKARPLRESERKRLLAETEH